MSARDFLSLTNIMFIIAGIYLLAIPALAEGSVYSALAAVLCFVAVGLWFEKDWFFSVPWRVATSTFVLILVSSQLAADATAPGGSSISGVASVIVNGALFVLFLGVTLSTLYDSVKKESEEEKVEEAKEEEDEKRRRETKKITYEV